MVDCQNYFVQKKGEYKLLHLSAFSLNSINLVVLVLWRKNILMCLKVWMVDYFVQKEGYQILEILTVKVPTRKRNNWYVLKLNLEGRLSRLLCAKRGLAVGGHSLRARSPLSPAWPSMFLKQTKILNKIQMCEKTQIGVQAKVQICQMYINTNTSNFYRHFK